MPVDISSNRPAAFRRGPIANPRSVAVSPEGFRLAIFSKAEIPGLVRPPLIRLSPSSTRILLFRSSATTSAMVPNATRSS